MKKAVEKITCQRWAQEAKIDVKRMPAHSYRQVHEYQQQQSFSPMGHQAAAQTTSKKPKLKSSPAREILSQNSRVVSRMSSHG
jgi:hypothetical protein